MILDHSIDALNPSFRTYLRLVETDDAKLICELRGDPSLNRYISPSVNEIEKQREWISRYKERESAGAEYYFVIVSEGIDHGLVRLYDFREVGGLSSFTRGSWIIRPPRPKGLVTFSSCMVFEVGFDSLKFQHCRLSVRRANHSVVAFHERAGAIRTGENDLDIFFSYTPAEYAVFRAASLDQIRLHRTPVV
jgi:RimJ/RimL family protein N-acetyltransferase